MGVQSKNDKETSNRAIHTIICISEDEHQGSVHFMPVRFIHVILNIAVYQIKFTNCLRYMTS